MILLIISLQACMDDRNMDRSEALTRSVDASTFEGDACTSECPDGLSPPGLSISEDMSPHSSADMTPSTRDQTIDEPLPDMITAPLPAPCHVAIKITNPSNESFYETHETVPLRGQLTTLAGEPVSQHIVHIIDETDGLAVELVTDINGVFEGEYTGSSSGLTRLIAKPMTEGGSCQEESQVDLYFCGALVTEGFQEEPQDWTAYGDAVWDPAGWLEMTGVSMDRKGSFYNTVEVISSGFASIEFVIMTGGGIHGGADGFAFTIVELSHVDQLRSLLDAADAGGGLGYTVGGVYAQPDFQLPGAAITVEIDTWQNEYNGTNQLHTDPTPENHIAITRNADSSDHLVWFEVPDIEDLQPHSIRVDLLRNRIRVSYDGQQVIEEEAIFTFKGGYMFFSGSTGWATNFHRFDDLRILHACR